jgi:O-antigen/teichoic acid export membrane protein
MTGSSLHNVLTGTVMRYALLFIQVGVGVVLMPFTMRHLGTEEYGLWMVVASCTAYFQLLDLGYGSALVRHVADADARGDIGGVNRIVSTFFVVYAALGAVAAAGIVALALWVVPDFPNLSPAQVQTAQLVLAMLGARIVVGLPMTIFGAITTARQRFALNNRVAIVVVLVNAAVTYLVLASGHGLLALVASTTTVGLASYGAYIWTAKRAMPELRVRVSSFRPAIVRDVTSFSVYVFIISVAAQIGFNLDNLVIGAALGTSAVAIYTVAFRLADYQRQLCNQLNSLLFPVVVRLEAEQRSADIREMLIETTRIALSLVMAVTICMIGFGQPLIDRWMGPGFDRAVAPLYVLALTGIVLVGQGPLGNVLLATGRHRLVAGVSLGEALANLGLSLVLVQSLGILGVAIGTAIPVAVANLFILLPAACRRVDLPLSTFARRVGTPAVMGAVPAIVICAGLRAWHQSPSLAAIVAQAALILVVYAIALCAFGLQPGERARYFGYGRRIIASAPFGRARVSEAVS